MKLIIREYLSLLKESTELDRLIPDLLLMMGIEPISHAQIGVRQYGVDVAAAGKYKNEENTLLLLTIKKGDIGRAEWNSTEQSVRQSLDEIKDVYINSHVSPEYSFLKKVIILCSGGDIKQDTQLNWKGYIEQNTIPGCIEYEFWGGDKLAILIEEYMFNENIVPNELRSSFRKVLSLISDPDYDLLDYYKILNKLIVDPNLGDLSLTSNIKKVVKTFKTINLLLNIIFYWSRNEDNLKPSIIAAERTLLFTWNFLLKNDLLNNESYLSLFMDIYRSYFSISSDYFLKIQKYCYVRGGMNGYGRHSILENINLFEQLGILCTIGLQYVLPSTQRPDEKLFANARIIVDAIKAQIINHPLLSTPYFDNHIIELSEAIYLLHIFSENNFINKWIDKIANNIAFAYKTMGKYFPIETDSIDDAVTLFISGSVNKEKLIEMSTLIPILSQWCAVLGFNELYTLIKEIANNLFSETTLQIWYPDAETENHIYLKNAAYYSGIVDAPIHIPDSIEQMKGMIKLVKEKTLKMENISSIKYGFSILPFISSRHFRTPLLPCFWQILIENEETAY